MDAQLRSCPCGRPGAGVPRYAAGHMNASLQGRPVYARLLATLGFVVIALLTMAPGFAVATPVASHPAQVLRFAAPQSTEPTATTTLPAGPSLEQNPKGTSDSLKDVGQKFIFVLIAAVLVAIVFFGRRWRAKNRS